MTSEYSLKRLSEEDDIASFHCGDEAWQVEVSDFLIEDALAQQGMGLNVTWLFYKDEELVGYTSLVSSDLKLEKDKGSTPKWKSILGLSEIKRENVPCGLVAQFGVTTKYQKQGRGNYMLSWIRGAAFQLHFGIKLLTLHVDRRNKLGRHFWESQGFINFPLGGSGKQLFMVFNLYGRNPAKE